MGGGIMPYGSMRCRDASPKCGDGGGGGGGIGDGSSGGLGVVWLSTGVVVAREVAPGMTWLADEVGTVEVVSSPSPSAAAKSALEIEGAAVGGAASLTAEGWGVAADAPASTAATAVVGVVVSALTLPKATAISRIFLFWTR